MSTTAVSTPASSAVAHASSVARSLPTRAISFFSGPVGLVVKLILLGLSNALAVWAGVLLIDRRSWVAVSLLVAATVVIDAVYLANRRWIPAKFILPGTIFLVAFQIVPIVYTVELAFSNYSTGHIASKRSAIDAIKRNSLAPAESGKTFTMAPARDASGRLVLALVDEDTNKPFIGTPSGLKPLPKDALALASDGTIKSVTGYHVIGGNELFHLDRQLANYRVPIHGGAIQPQGVDSAAALAPTLRYDSSTDTFVRLKDHLVFRDSGHGAYAAANGEELEPGWRSNVGFKNFGRIVHSSLVRHPFLRVFGWTFAFAILSVVLTFALGLFLAITLDKKGLRFRGLYRSILIIPYAVPGFLSILVWQGLLNDDYGVVNRVFHLHVQWLFDPNWAKVSALLVNLWLGFPYFFLVCLGALQSIPSELTEAARVDGASALQIFRRVTLPLLLIAVTPLLIASFAFNFNNFNAIYLLTGGGPPSNDGSIAGGTDLLISYTYKLAIASGKGQDFGLAASISILIFIIVATISAVGFWRSRALENIR